MSTGLISHHAQPQAIRQISAAFPASFGGTREKRPQLRISQIRERCPKDHTRLRRLVRPWLAQFGRRQRLPPETAKADTGYHTRLRKLICPWLEQFGCRQRQSQETARADRGYHKHTVAARGFLQKQKRPQASPSTP